MEMRSVSGYPPGGLDETSMGRGDKYILLWRDMCVRAYVQTEREGHGLLWQLPGTSWLAMVWYRTLDFFLACSQRSLMNLHDQEVRTEGKKQSCSPVIKTLKSDINICKASPLTWGSGCIWGGTGRFSWERERDCPIPHEWQEHIARADHHYQACKICSFWQNPRAVHPELVTKRKPEQSLMVSPSGTAKRLMADNEPMVECSTGIRCLRITLSVAFRLQFFLHTFLNSTHEY